MRIQKHENTKIWKCGNREMQKLKMRKHGNAKVENAETWKCKSWKCGNMEMQKLKMRKHGNAKCILRCRVMNSISYSFRSIANQNGVRYSDSASSPSRRREAPCEGTNSPRLFTPGETKALGKSKVHQISRAWVTVRGWSSSLISKIWRTVMNSEHRLVKFKICCCMTNDDFNWQILNENNLLFALQYFVRLQKLLTAFKAICSIKSLIKQLRYQIRIEKIWSQMKSGKEMTRKSSV